MPNRELPWSGSVRHKISAMPQKDISTRLNTALDSHTLELLFAMQGEPITGGPPEQEIEAASSQIVLVSHVIARRRRANASPKNWDDIAREHIVGTVIGELPTRQVLFDSVFFDRSLAPERMLKAVLRDVEPVGIEDKKLFEGGVALGKVATRAYIDASASIKVSDIANILESMDSHRAA